MDNLPKLLALFKDFVANFGGHILLVNHVLLIHITDNLTSTSPIPLDYMLFETICALQKGLREATAQDGNTSFFDVPIISSLRRQQEWTYQDVHKHTIMDRMPGRTVCESFLSLMGVYAQLSRAEDEALMKSKYSSSILESLWWDLEAGDPELDISVGMILSRFQASAQESAEPKLVLIDCSIVIQYILEHYKRKNLDPRSQEDLYKRLKFGKVRLDDIVVVRQHELDDERTKKQRLAEERAQMVDSQARRALKETEKALAAIKPEGVSIFGERPDTATGGSTADPSSGLH